MTVFHSLFSRSFFLLLWCRVKTFCVYQHGNYTAKYLRQKTHWKCIVVTPPEEEKSQKYILIPATLGIFVSTSMKKFGDCLAALVIGGI